MIASNLLSIVLLSDPSSYKISYHGKEEVEDDDKFKEWQDYIPSQEHCLVPHEVLKILDEIVGRLWITTKAVILKSIPNRQGNVDTRKHCQGQDQCDLVKQYSLISTSREFDLLEL